MTEPADSNTARSAEGEMRAIVHDRYGSFDLLKLREIERPAPGEGEVLVRVHAVGLHVGDCFGVRGAPFVMRIVGGLLRPKLGIPGFDVAGCVEAVGEGVSRFAPGDEVFGACEGGCAEYVCVSSGTLAAKPPGLTFEQAAAIPTSGLAALHALRDVARVASGQKVLINGASGGVGSFAVQIASAYGAEVTGVCSSRNVELLRSIGAAHVVDYGEEDFTDGETHYDLILDNVENRSLEECRRALGPHGMLILNSGTGASGMRMMARLIKPLLLSPFVRHDLRRYLSLPNSDDLTHLGELVESERLRPIIDRTYPLIETAEALRYIEAGHARGKVVVVVAD